MTTSVTITFTVPAAKKHWQQMRRTAQRLTNVRNSVEVFLSSNDPKRLTARFSVPDARQVDVVDGIGRAFLWELADYSDISIGFGPRKR